MYKQYNNPQNELVTNMVMRISDGAFIPFDPDNTDYQAYLKWVSEGNKPMPADK